jgi:hypothetical protein
LRQGPRARRAAAVETNDMRRILCLCHGSVHSSKYLDAFAHWVGAREAVTVSDKFDDAPDVVGDLARASTWAALRRSRGLFDCVVSLHCPTGGTLMASAVTLRSAIHDHVHDVLATGGFYIKKVPQAGTVRRDGRVLDRRGREDCVPPVGMRFWGVLLSARPMRAVHDPTGMTFNPDPHVPQAWVVYERLA